MATIGMAMSIITVLTWGIMLAINYHMPRTTALKTLKRIRRELLIDI